MSERVVVLGMHFMNAVPVMQLVEVIRGLATSDDTTQRVLELARKLGKVPMAAGWLGRKSGRGFYTY